MLVTDEYVGVYLIGSIYRMFTLNDFSIYIILFYIS